MEETDQQLLVNADVRNDSTDKPCFAYRYKLVLLVAFGFYAAMASRVTINIALVDMVNYTAFDNYTSDECAHIPTSNSSDKQGHGNFQWSSKTQSLLLGSFFYGYILTQFLGGYISETVGPKIVFLCAILTSSIFSIASPFMANWGSMPLFVCRFLMGLAQGPIFPGNTVLWSRWAPSSQLTILYSLSFAGSTLGGSSGAAITGILCNLSFLGGWPIPFYLFGILGLFWSILWYCFAYSSPADHPKLSLHEKHVITKGRSYSSQNTSLKRPFRAMISSRCVWAVIIYFFFDGLGFYILYSGIPIYLKQILRFDITENGFINSVPYIGTVVTNLLGSFSADYLRRNNYLTTKSTRKLFTLLGEGLVVFCILGMGFLPCDRTAAVVLFTAAMSINGLTVAGAPINVLDIAPKYAGTLMGVCNLVVNLGGFISPLIVDAITKDSPNRSDWQTVFYITAAIYGIATLSFLLLGEGEEQEWAKDSYMNPTLTINQTDALEPADSDSSTVQNTLHNTDS